MRRFVILLASGLAFATPVAAQEKITLQAGENPPAVARLLRDLDQVVIDLKNASASILRVQESCKAVYVEQEQAVARLLQPGQANIDREHELSFMTQRAIAIEACRKQHPRLLPAADPVQVKYREPSR